MRFPFVSRGRYDDMVARVHAEREVCQFLRRDLMSSAEQWSELVNRERERADRAEARCQQLRLMGAVPVVPVVSAPKPDPIAKAISLRCGGDPDLRDSMWEQVERDRAGGMGDGDILMAIQLGHTATDGGPIL